MMKGESAATHRNFRRGGELVKEAGRLLAMGSDSLLSLLVLSGE